MHGWLLCATLALTQGSGAPAPLGPGSPPPVPFEQRGLSIGQTIPPLDLVDQSGRRRNVKDLAGPNGLVLLFVRSADW
jgi:hypothetical protein